MLQIQSNAFIYKQYRNLECLPIWLLLKHGKYGNDASVSLCQNTHFEITRSYRDIECPMIPNGFLVHWFMTATLHGNALRIIGALWGESEEYHWNPHITGQWCRALMFLLMSAWTNYSNKPSTGRWTSIFLRRFDVIVTSRVELPLHS